MAKPDASNRLPNVSAMQLKVCTDNENDWVEFIELCVISFQESAPFVRSHPDPVKREAFLMKYIKHHYETELSNGRAGLACVKMQNAFGREEIIYGSCCQYGHGKRTESDQGPMRELDAIGWEKNEMEDEWLELQIHSKMPYIAEFLNVNIMHGVYHATLEEYKGKGIAKHYTVPAITVIFADGIRRGILDGAKPTIIYGVIDDYRALGLQKLTGYDEIYHLHNTHDKNYIKCINDSKE
uniref:uncharacterized protein LOC120338076 n=1 Tax=Styela clava TaxID=7725 RepID=UPI001939E30A|nr:uncharacterized protein LOC120338076 [Styela clava]